MMTYYQHNGLTHPPVMAKFKPTPRPCLGIDIREGPTPNFHLRGATPQRTLRNFLQYSLDALKTVTHSFYKQASILVSVTSQRSSNLRILLGLLTLWITSLPIAAATIVVNSNLDTTGTAGICTLRDAITAANTNAVKGGCAAGSSGATMDMITFAPSLSGQTITLTATLPTLTGKLTIDGTSLASHVQISGNNTYQVFYISLGTVILTHLDITKGNASYGGGIYNDKGTLTVNNSTFSGNSATSSGGGIYNSSISTLTVNNSTFLNNSASNQWWEGGGGIFNSKDGTLTVNNSTFSGNSSINHGGGIHNDSNTFTVNNSTFLGNSASNGGGIFNAGSRLSTVNNSTFSGNSSDYSGGSIYNGGSTLTVNNSTFSGNSSDYLGGGIHNETSSTLTVNNSTFSRNSSDLGGGICNETNSTLTVNNSTFSRNLSTYVGGGIYGDTGSTLTVNNSTFSGNSSSFMGGGICNFISSTLTVNNSTFSGNSASTRGGGISNSNILTLKNSILANNTSSTGSDCTGTVAAGSINNLIKATGTHACGLTNGKNGNLIGIDPLLGPLVNNGGSTQTFALLAGSPAIDNGNPATCLDTDQRDYERVGTCDIGAFEYGAVPPTYAFSTVKDPASTGTGSIATTTTANGNYTAGTAIKLATTGLGVGETVTWSPATCAALFPMPASVLTCTATFTAATTLPSSPVTPITPVIPTMPITPTTPVVPTMSITPGTSSLPDPLGLFLQIDGPGEGKVMTDTGLSCQSRDCQVNQEGELVCNPLACHQAVKTGTTVTLTPQADAGSVFSSWGGSEDCVDGRVFMNGGHLCIAFFHRIDPLRVTLQGQGQVMGYGSDQQLVIDCGTNCQAFFSRGTPVSLQAIPSQGMMFGGWRGECGHSTQNPLVLEVTQDMECQATFVAPMPGVTPPPLPVTPATMDIPTDTTPARDTTTEFTTPVTLPEVPTDLPGVTASPVATPQPQSAEVDSTAQGTTPATDTMPGVPTPWPPATMLPPVVTLPQPGSEAVETHMQGITPSLEVTPLSVTTLPLVQGPDFFHCATTGDVDDVCNYGGQEVINLNVQTHGLVSNGVVQTTLVNQGWVSNFTITETGQLRGGVVTGYIKNQGVMLDFDFKGLSLIGGTLGGVITNTSRVGGYFQDVMLQANTKITGGTLQGILQGDQQSPALLEHVTIKTGSYLSGIKLGQGVKLEGQVVIEPLEEMPGGQATE